MGINDMLVALSQIWASCVTSYPDTEHDEMLGHIEALQSMVLELGGEKKLRNWYEENIEPQVRTEVKLLRNAGINTTCSCGHEMWIEADVPVDGQVYNAHLVLLNSGHRNYVITTELTVENGHILGSFMNIQLEGD